MKPMDNSVLGAKERLYQDTVKTYTVFSENSSLGFSNRSTRILINEAFHRDARKRWEDMEKRRIS